MKAYVAGKISGNDNFVREFKLAQEALEDQGYIVMNPSILPCGFEQLQYLHICKAMIDVCEVVFFLPNWVTSCGSHFEMGYATGAKKEIKFLS